MIADDEESKNIAKYLENYLGVIGDFNIQYKNGICYVGTFTETCQFNAYNSGQSIFETAMSLIEPLKESVPNFSSALCYNNSSDPRNPAKIIMGGCLNWPLTMPGRTIENILDNLAESMRDLRHNLSFIRDRIDEYLSRR